MKTVAFAAALAVAAVSVPAFAQEMQHDHAALAPAAAAPAAGAAGAGAPATDAPASGKLSVQTSTIDQIISNGQAKAALEKALPDIAQYYSMIGGMTLVDIQSNPQSEGRITDAMLKDLQAEFDKVN